MFRKIVIVSTFAVAGVLAWQARGESKAPAGWPPKLQKRYPDLLLVDQHDRPFRLSSLRGKLILLEPIGMNCGACQAFCGGNQKGGFAGVTPQANLLTMKQLFGQYAKGIAYDDPRIVHVYLLLYNMALKPTTAKDAKAWAEHFDFAQAKNEVVLAGSRGLLGKEAYDMIPGYQLIDQDFVLRADSTGHHPRHNLYTELLPMVPKLLASE